MHALISTLDEVANQRVTRLWEILAENCNLQGILRIPLPHFSWHGANAYHVQKLEPLLAKWSRQVEPFQVRTNGLGIFTGDKPIIHLRLVTTDGLEKYHRQIWQHVQTTSPNGPSAYYAPHTWLPHITLGIEDVNALNIGCAVKLLAFQTFDWLIRIDNLMLVSHEPDQSGEIIRRFQLGKNDGTEIKSTI